MSRTYLGTGDGVYRLGDDGPVSLDLKGLRFWAIHAWQGEDGRDVVLAGSYGEGMFRSDDSGQTWTEANDGLHDPVLRCIVPDPHEHGVILAGTEPGRIYRSRDGGLSWSEMESVREISSCLDWFLPYSPRAGAVRNIYSPPGQGGVLLASVEVGGLLRSDDNGATWELVGVDPGPRVHDDVHEITGHPHNPELLYVALGGALVDREQMRAYLPQPGEVREIGGVARSDDGGHTWRKILTHYTRSVIVPPSRPDLLLAGPAERTDHGGWIAVSCDGGETWQPADSGIDTPMPDMVEKFVPAPDGSVWAICSAGRLFRATPGEWQWRQITGSGLAVESVSFVE